MALMPKTAVPVVAGAVRQVHDQLEEEARSVVIKIYTGGNDGRPLSTAKKENEVLLRFLAEGGPARSSQWGAIQERVTHIAHVDARSIVCADDDPLPSGPGGERPEGEETEEAWAQKLARWRAGRHERRMRKMHEWFTSVLLAQLAQNPQQQLNGWDHKQDMVQLRRATEGCRGAHELLRVGFLSAEQREAVLMLLFAQLGTALRTPTLISPPYACPAPSQPLSFCGHLCWAVWQGCTEADGTEMLLTRTSLLWDLVVVAEQAADDVERKEQRTARSTVIEEMVELESKARATAGAAAVAVANADARLQRAKDDLEQLRDKAGHHSRHGHGKHGHRKQSSSHGQHGSSSHSHRKQSSSHGHRDSSSHGHRKQSSSHGHRKQSSSHGHHSSSSHGHRSSSLHAHDKHRKHGEHGEHSRHEHGKHGKHRRHSQHKLPASVDEAQAKVSEAEKALTQIRNECECVPRVASAQQRQEWAETAKAEAERAARSAGHHAYCPTQDYLVALLVRLASSPRGRAAICDNKTPPQWRQRALRALLHAALHAASRMNAGRNARTRGTQRSGARQPLPGMSSCGRHIPWAAVFRAAVLAVSASVQSRAGELFDVRGEREHRLQVSVSSTAAPPPITSSGSKTNDLLLMLGHAGQYLQLMLKVAIAARVKMLSNFSVQPDLRLRTVDETANTAEHASLCVMVIAARLTPLLNDCAADKVFEAMAEVSMASTAAAESLKEEFEHRWSRVPQDNKPEGNENAAVQGAWQHTTISGVPFDNNSLWPPRAGNGLLEQVSALSMPGDWLDLTADNGGKLVHLDVTHKSTEKMEAPTNSAGPGPSKSLDNLLRRSFAWTSMRLCLHGIGCVSLLESCVALGSSSYNGQSGVRIDKKVPAPNVATAFGVSSKLAYLRQYIADLQVREWVLESHMESVMHALADRMLRGKDYFVSLCGTHVALTLNTTLPRARCQRKQWQKQRRERLWQRCWQQQTAQEPKLILQASSARKVRVARQLEAEAKERDVARQLEAEANVRDEARRREEEEATREAERQMNNEIEAALAEAQLHQDETDNIGVGIDVFEQAKVHSIAQESVGGHGVKKPSFLPTMTRALLYCRAAPRSAALLARSVGAAVAARSLTAAESLLCLRRDGKSPFETATDVARLSISQNGDVIQNAVKAAPQLRQLLSFLQMPLWVGTKGTVAMTEKNRVELAAAAGAGSARSLLLSVAIALVLLGCEERSSRDQSEDGAPLDMLLSLCTVMCQWISSCALVLFPSAVRSSGSRIPSWARRACLWFKRLELGEGANGGPADAHRSQNAAENSEAMNTLNAALCGLWALLSSTRCCHGSEIGAVLRCFMAKNGYVRLLVLMLQVDNDCADAPASGGDIAHNLATKKYPLCRLRRLCLGTLWAYCGDQSQDEALRRAGKGARHASASDRSKHSSLLHEAGHCSSLACAAHAGVLHALARGAGPAAEVLLRPTLPAQRYGKGSVFKHSIPIRRPAPVRRSKTGSSARAAPTETVSWTNMLDGITEMLDRLQTTDDVHTVTATSINSMKKKEETHTTSTRPQDLPEMPSSLQGAADIDANFVCLCAKMMYSVALRMRAHNTVCGLDYTLRVILGDIHPTPSNDEVETESSSAVEARDQGIVSSPPPSESSSPLPRHRSTSPSASDLGSETGTSPDTAKSPRETPTHAADKSPPRRIEDAQVLPPVLEPWDTECNRAPVHMLLCIPALHLQTTLYGDQVGHDVQISGADMLFALQAIGRYASLGRSRSQLIASGAVSILLSCALQGMRAAIDEDGASDTSDMSMMCCSLRALLHLSRDKDAFAKAVSPRGTIVAHDAINRARDRGTHSNQPLHHIFGHAATSDEPQEPGLLDIVLLARALSRISNEGTGANSKQAASSIVAQLLRILSTSPLHRSALYGAELTFGAAAARSFGDGVIPAPDSARPVTAPASAHTSTVLAPPQFQRQRRANNDGSTSTRTAQRHHSREQSHARARAKVVAGVQRNSHHIEDKKHVVHEAAEDVCTLPTLRWDLSRPSIRSITDMGTSGPGSAESLPDSQWAPRLQSAPHLQRTEVSVRATVEKQHQMELLSTGRGLRTSQSSAAQELEKQKRLDEERWLSRQLRTRAAGAPHANKLRNLIGVSSATDELRIVLEPNNPVKFPAAGATGCRSNVFAAGDALMRRRKKASGMREFEQARGKTNHSTAHRNSTLLSRMAITDNAQRAVLKLPKSGAPQCALFRAVPGGSGKLYEGVTAPHIVPVGSGANAKAVYLYSSDGICGGGMLIDPPAQRSIGVPSFEELMLSEEEKRIRSIASSGTAQHAPSMKQLASNMTLVSKAISLLSVALQPKPPEPPTVAVANAALIGLNEALVHMIKRVPDPHWHSLLAPAIRDKPLELVVFGPARAITPPPPEPEPEKPPPVEEEKKPERAPEPEPDPPTPREKQPVYDLFVARPFDNASKSFFSLPTRWEVLHEQSAGSTPVLDTTREALAFDWSRCCRQRDFLSLIDGVAGTLCSSAGQGCSIGWGCKELSGDLVADVADATSETERSWVMAELRDIFEVFVYNFAVLNALFNYYCSKSRDPFSMHMNEFNMFCRAARFTKGEGQVKQRDLDTLFIAANCVDADDKEEQTNNEEDGICRHEMLELLVRIAIMKFRRGKMGFHGPASSVAEAVSMLFSIHVCKIKERCYAGGPLCAVPLDTFRRETLYTEDITDALGPHVPILTAIHGWWCGTSSPPMWKLPKSLRHSFQWVAGGKKIQRMFWEDFLALFDDLDLCNEDITRKELRLAFLQARAVVPDNVKDRARSITLSSLDFLEALVRLARVSGSDDAPLHMRVDELASRVLTNFDNKWGDGDGKITLADFDKQTNRRHKASRRLSVMHQ